MSLWQGKRQEARGKSEEGLGDFTFLYTVWFYCVHLLSTIANNYLKSHNYYCAAPKIDRRKSCQYSGVTGSASESKPSCNKLANFA
ncbi:MAG: hypothetical protein HEQ20_11490 [Aphanizomenon flos-aquae KM1D3_PB]|uniref:hypothetical protein n=1 Tax=Aphanizomenon flos-aquae TaxID=1176 RepID=UPI001362F192|nr:hypothetical protein [Aphanizomenon flos-aquae]QSV71269.1 MAG: hypothetical protein HEQ20_11490 [Aphanizomenon flos-aquae KM1D3_PB]